MNLIYLKAGFLETTWELDRSTVVSTGLSEYVDALLNTVNDTGVRHKFRTRIERGNGADSTNIYISHRVIQEAGIGQPAGFTRLPSDPILEVEMMRRMMLTFRTPEENLITITEVEELASTNDLFEIQDNRLVIFRLV